MKKIKFSEEFEEFFNSKERSFITELFNNVILTKHICKCNEETNSFNSGCQYFLFIWYALCGKLSGGLFS